jgi:AcrR family transcriptional regulator
MQTEKKSRKKPGNTTGQKLTNAYKEFVLMNGHKPASIYKFCIDIGITEEEFYSHFGSFEGLEKQIWKGFVDETIHKLKSDNSFAGFSAREKILAFYFTLLEVMKSSRSFILLQLQGFRKPELIPDFLKGFKASFDEFIADALNEGRKNGEIANRPFLDNRYPGLFWVHACLLLLFWKEDDSSGFEKTDVYVEKSVNLAFDLIGKGVVDSTIDFAKFMFQSKMKF